MPCERSSLRRSASSSLLVVSIPPSPVVRFLLEKKLKQPISPMLPHCLKTRSPLPSCPLPGNVTEIDTIVHHADALGSRVKTGRKTLWGDVTVLDARDIGKDRCGAGIADGIGRGHEGQRWTDDRIAWPRTKCQVRQVQRRCAVGHSQSMIDTHHSSKLLLELR